MNFAARIEGRYHYWNGGEFLHSCRRHYPRIANPFTVQMAILIEYRRNATSRESSGLRQQPACMVACTVNENLVLTRFAQATFHFLHHT
jgi:hypothetical protein